MAIGIVVCGVGGRMGGAVVRAIQQTPGVKLVAAIDKPGGARLGKDAGEIAGTGHSRIAVTDDLAPFLEPNIVVVDFTNPAASVGYLKAAAAKAVPIVIGTTGFDAAQTAEIANLAHRTPTLVSAKPLRSWAKITMSRSSKRTTASKRTLRAVRLWLWDAPLPTRSAATSIKWR
jgi:4-hydroxy-tetrahydrodipicolinate reductase